jgi:hypothetical protein
MGRGNTEAPSGEGAAGGARLVVVPVVLHEPRGAGESRLIDFPHSSYFWTSSGINSPPIAACLPDLRGATGQPKLLGLLAPPILSTSDEFRSIMCRLFPLHLGSHGLYV